MKTWIELTYSEGREGFTEFLKAPLRKENGAKFIYYSNLHLVKKGDRIYHIDLSYGKVTGYSYALNDGEIKNVRYKVDLEKYTEFEEKIDLKRLYKSKYIELINYYKKNKESSNHKSIFYIPYREGIRSMNGGYLSELTLDLQEILFGEEFIQKIEDEDGKIPKKIKTNILRRIRDTKIVRELKENYENKCQICGLSLLKSKNKSYSEGHHLHSLGEDGPDIKENIMILCSNHHTEFDYKTIAINPRTGKIEHLNTDNIFNGKVPNSFNKIHIINDKFLEYHYNKFKEKHD